MRLFSQTFEHEGVAYRFELGVDHASLLEGNLNIPITARRIGTSGEQGAEINAVLTLDHDRNRILITIEGIEIGFVPLGEMGSAEAEAMTDDGNVAFEWPVFLQFLEPEGSPVDEIIEDIIQALPCPGDPVLGCLIKSGIASTAGQMTRCYFGTQGHEGRLARVKAIARCLGKNSSRIFWATIKRTFNCVLRLGF